MVLFQEFRDETPPVDPPFRCRHAEAAISFQTLCQASQMVFVCVRRRWLGIPWCLLSHSIFGVCHLLAGGQVGLGVTATSDLEPIELRSWYQSFVVSVGRALSPAFY